MERCIDPMGEPAWYLGILRSACDGVTLRLHAYLTDGEDVVSYSAVGPRQNPEDAQVLLTLSEPELVQLAIAGDERGALPGWEYNDMCESWDNHNSGSSIFLSDGRWLLVNHESQWSVTDPRAGMREDLLS